MPMIRFHPDHITFRCDGPRSEGEVFEIILSRVIPEHRAVARGHAKVREWAWVQSQNLERTREHGSHGSMSYNLSERIFAELPQSYLDQVAAKQAAIAMAQQQQAIAQHQAALEAARQADLQRQQVAAARIAEGLRQQEIQRQEFLAEAKRLEQIVHDAEINYSSALERMRSSEAAYVVMTQEAKPLAFTALALIVSSAEELSILAETCLKAAALYQSTSESAWQFGINTTSDLFKTASKVSPQLGFDLAAAESARLAEIYNQALAAKERVSEYVRQARMAKEVAAIEEEQQHEAEAALAETSVDPDVTAAVDSAALGNLSARVSTMGIFAARPAEELVASVAASRAAP